MNMKKRFVIFALMLMAAVGMQAQSLIGTWKNVTEEYGTKIDMCFIFNQSTFSLKTTFTQTDPQVGTITMSILLPGTYTCSGNTLILKPKGEQAKMNLDKVDFNEEITQTIKEMPELKKTITDAMEKSMNEGKDELVNKYSSMTSDLTMESLTDTKLIFVEEDGEKVIFTKVR